MTQENRYAKGKIYRLVNNVDGEEYVGSTCDTLPSRLWSHKTHAKKETKRRVYHHLNEIGWDKVSIVLVEEYPCNNKMELERREYHFVKELSPSLNTVLPARTYKEYCTDNADKIKERMRSYRQKNADKIREQTREYHAEHKEAINERHRQKRLVNKAHGEEGYLAKKVEQTMKWYRENKDIINARRRERYAQKKAEREAS